MSTNFLSISSVMALRPGMVMSLSSNSTNCLNHLLSDVQRGAILSNSLPDFFLSEVWVNSLWTTLLTRRTLCSSSSLTPSSSSWWPSWQGGVTQERQLASSIPYLSMTISGNRGNWRLRGANKEPKVHRSFKVQFQKGKFT